MQRIASGALVCLLLLSTSAFADVLCARKIGANVKLRDVCKPKEMQLDPVALNLQGSQGVPGNDGAPGQDGTTIPCVSASNTDVFFTGCNVHIVNGAGSTATTNGLGNLIVGYNESVDNEDLYRSGSHNVVIGRRHKYTSFAGFVAGYQNTITGENASVSGGHANSATGKYSSISGGYAGTANAELTSVSGGYNNSATGSFASVSGGNGGIASGSASSVSGGVQNTATSDNCSVSGGYANSATYFASSVSGGMENSATAYASSVSGGNQRTAPALHNWAAGSLSEPN